MTVSDRITNQLMLDSIYLAAQETETNRFDLIERANLWELFYDRTGEYRGNPLVSLSGLADDEKKNIQRKLIESLARRQNTTALTLGHLNLRSGPGTQYSTLQTLPPDSNLSVMGEAGDWVHVQVDGRQGYVHRDYVKLPHQPVKSRLLAVQPELLRIALPPLPDQMLDTSRLAQGTLLFAVADLWNRYGGLLVVLCNELDIHPSVALAVLLAESGGRGFAPGPNGQRMIIRFENHIFYDRWGRNNQERFDRHFAYAPGQTWKGHLWRPDPGAAWQGFHGNQQKEWEVLTFASGLDRRAARESISMGLPQIMGFNAVAVGYPQADAMFDAFASGEARQIFGFFDFVRSKGGVSPLRGRDYPVFAGLYNGPGQAPVYAAIIQERVDIFERLWAEKKSDTRGIGLVPGSRPDPSVDFDLPRSPTEEDRVALRRQLAGLLADQRRALLYHQALLVVTLLTIVTGLGLLVAGSVLGGIFSLLVGLAGLAGYFLVRPEQMSSAFRAKIAELEGLLDRYEQLPW
ncbi:MAG: DUF3380 domain-containing protein [Caldilineaceae bacterium]|nr:DUF3380 domain-containing protein [Caldilineaceae bacterium]